MGCDPDPLRTSPETEHLRGLVSYFVHTHVRADGRILDLIRNDAGSDLGKQDDCSGVCRVAQHGPTGGKPRRPQDEYRPVGGTTDMPSPPPPARLKIAAAAPRCAVTEAVDASNGWPARVSHKRALYDGKARYYHLMLRLRAHGNRLNCQSRRRRTGPLSATAIERDISATAIKRDISATAIERYN